MSYKPPLTSHLSIPPGASRSLRALLSDAIMHLEREDVPSPALAAELLLMRTLDKDRAWLYAHPEHALDAATQEKYFSLVAQRIAGVPTQHLTGHQEFWGLDFEVTPAVLIPRPETEHVIEVALDRLGVSGANIVANSPRRQNEFQIADVGTGSGCIAISLAQELPNAKIVATDISSAALEVARRNAARHNAAERISFIECSLLDAVFQKSPPFDLIASNPPYIARRDASTLPREVRDHEPDTALYGGETGTKFYAPLITQAANLLKPGGILVLELGHNSAEHVSALLDAPEWIDVNLTNDLAGIARVVSAKRK